MRDDEHDVIRTEIEQLRKRREHDGLACAGRHRDDLTANTLGTRIDDSLLRRNLIRAKLKAQRHAHRIG
jgi:hypothetical protein